MIFVIQNKMDIYDFYDIDKIKYKDYERFINDVFEKNIIVSHNLDANHHYLLGRYYERKQYVNNMLINYNFAINNGNNDAKYNLALYYFKIKNKDYESLLISAINSGCQRSIILLVRIYKYEMRIDDMLLYAHYAIEQYNCSICPYIVSIHYKQHLNIVKMKYYIELAINNGNVQAMFSYGKYLQYVENDYEKSEHYYLMASIRGNEEALKKLEYIYINKHGDAISLYMLLINISNRNNIINKMIDKIEIAYLNYNVNSQQLM